MVQLVICDAQDWWFDPQFQDTQTIGFGKCFIDDLYQDLDLEVFSDGLKYYY